MTSSSSVATRFKRPFNLSPSHKISVLFDSSPVLGTMPEVRAFFDLFETRFAAPSRKAIGDRLLTYDETSWKRGTMLLPSELSTALEAVRQAIYAIPTAPDGKTKSERFQDFQVVYGILMNGIHHALKGDKPFTGSAAPSASGAKIYQFTPGLKQSA